MDPKTVATELRRIARRIDSSPKPNREAISRRIAALHSRLANGADKQLISFITEFESREPFIQELIMALSAADQLYLKEEGYSSEDKLKGDDSESAKHVKNVYELLRKQSEVIANALRAAQPEIAALDREMHNVV